MTMCTIINALKVIKTTALPYLPPPVIAWIGYVDESVWIRTSERTSEGFMILVTTALLAWFLHGLIRSMLNVISSHDKEDTAQAYNEDVLSNITNTNKSTLSSDILVIICGAVGSGKTRIFHNLLQQQQQKSLTVSSSIASQGVYKYNDSDKHSATIDLMDYPGHVRLRGGLLNRSILGQRKLQRILFVVDSSISTTEAADFLYDVLLAAQNKIIHNKIRILVCCNKSDTKLAKNYKRIQLQLKAELNRLRGTRGTMDMEGNNETSFIEGQQLLGQKGTALDWDTAPCEVEFVSCSCESGAGMGDIRAFVEGQRNTA